MTESGVLILIVLGLAVIIGLWAVSAYNGLVVARNRYQNAYAQIDVQLKRRYDLIPNLVECVKGYMAHEKAALEAVVNARAAAFGAAQRAAARPGDPTAMKQLSEAETQLSGALGRLIAVAEAYPDLKANQNMLSLQEELSSTENKVSFARQAYNDAVTAYNNRRQTFPTAIAANLFGFGEAALLETAPAERAAPKVSFS
ncbi:MAG: LemA family protein [Gemmataceae bacterium]|nr:LemA family protein [Gemmataceae bacterium]MDW8264814.1 LemA family protein [Gemmataceae bacterium]